MRALYDVAVAALMAAAIVMLLMLVDSAHAAPLLGADRARSTLLVKKDIDKG